MLLERSVFLFPCLGELVDNIDVVSTLSFLVPVFRGLVDDTDVLGALSFRVSVFRGAGRRY